MDIPQDLRFAPTHEWARLEGDVVTVGISDHAQAELTDIVYLELPDAGRTVAAGEEVAVIESVKSASDIYAPAAGEIVEVNTALVDEPGGVNTDPYGAGWMFRIRVSGPDALEHLLSPDAYRDQIA